MIVVRLMGGLGNQLFQWACAKSISDKTGQEIYLDLSLLNSDVSGMTKRKYSLDKFTGIKNKVFGTQHLNGKPFLQINDDTKLLKYDNNVNYFVFGYFQKESFFSDSAKNVRSVLAAPKGLVEKYGVTDNSVSIHVRRTDYLESNGFHVVQDIDYYKSALCELETYDKLFVFSDDPSWCRDNLPFENMTVVTGNDEVVDLWLMSLCRDNIIANSTFSWWGAWLNKNPNKRVVYPGKWYGSHEADIACDGWIRI